MSIKRYENTDSRISYSGVFSIIPNINSSGGSHHEWNGVPGSVFFRFTGDTIKIYGRKGPNYVNEVIVSVDGNAATYSQYNETVLENVLLYEKTVSINKHAVRIWCNNTEASKNFNFDCLEIGDGYELLPAEIKIGEQLSIPEPGWTRFDDIHEDIHYQHLTEGSFSGIIPEDLTNYGPSYGGYTTQFYEGYCKFKFYGSKLRVLGIRESSGFSALENVIVTIDGVSVGNLTNNLGSPHYYMCLLFEKQGLQYGIHEVEIRNNNPNELVNIDCIDIDGTGHLLSSPPDIHCKYNEQTDEIDISWHHSDLRIKQYKLKYIVDNSSEEKSLYITNPNYGNNKYSIKRGDIGKIQISMCQIMSNGQEGDYSKESVINLPSTLKFEHNSWDNIMKCKWRHVYGLSDYKIKYTLNDGVEKIVDITSYDIVAGENSYNVQMGENNKIEITMSVVINGETQPFIKPFIRDYKVSQEFQENLEGTSFTIDSVTDNGSIANLKKIDIKEIYGDNQNSQFVGEPFDINYSWLQNKTTVTAEDGKEYSFVFQVNFTSYSYKYYANKEFIVDEAFNYVQTDDICLRVKSDTKEQISVPIGTQLPTLKQYGYLSNMPNVKTLLLNNGFNIADFIFEQEEKTATERCYKFLIKSKSSSNEEVLELVGKQPLRKTNNSIDKINFPHKVWREVKLLDGAVIQPITHPNYEHLLSFINCLPDGTEDEIFEENGVKKLRKVIDTKGTSEYNGNWGMLVEPIVRNLTNREISEYNSKLLYMNKNMQVTFFENKNIITCDNSTKSSMIKISIPRMSWVFLDKPINLKSTIDKSTLALTWDKVNYSSGYRVYVDGKLLGEVLTNTYHQDVELSGNVSVRAFNPRFKRDSEPLYIKTFPNPAINATISEDNTTDAYKLSFNFIDNSEIETKYKVKYTIDSSEEVVVELPPTEGSGQTISYTIEINEPILDKIKFTVVSCNSLGENEMFSPMTVLMTSDLRWGYQISEDRLVLEWNNIHSNIGFKVRYKIVGTDSYNYYLIPKEEVVIGKNRCKIPLYINQEAQVSISCMVDGNEQLYGRKVLGSYEKDNNAKAPKDFVYNWLSPGVVEFTWEDNYMEEDEFELHFELNDVPLTIKVPSNTSAETGHKYSYIYRFENYAILRAKCRMKYDLAQSAFSAEYLIPYRQIDGLPPSFIRKKRTDKNSYVLNWEAKESVFNYLLSIKKNSETPVEIPLKYDEYELLVDMNKPDTYEVSVKIVFDGGVVTEPSKKIVFKPALDKFKQLEINCNKTLNINNINSNFMTLDTIQRYVDNLMCMNKNIHKIKLDTLGVQKLQFTKFPMAFTFWGNSLTTSSPMGTLITDKTKYVNLVNTMIYQKIKEQNFVNTILRTFYKKDYISIMDITKVTILTFGDSITAGHPNYWAETGTGNPKSQYQYWLDRRLRGNFNIINKGYGSDTTDRMLARFNKDVLGTYCHYCIIQGGTNDLYWAMAEDNGNQDVLNRKLMTMKNNMTEMVKRCWDNGIYPILGTLIPRTGAVGIYQTALYDYNNWIKDFCNSNENIGFIDFFNAGKELYPPTPLEDPQRPGALNPLYDGDAIYDEYGAIIKPGRGIHPSPEGYKIMGQSVPLDLFQSQDEGVKIYLDEECTIEETYNQDSKSYSLSLNDIRLNKTKEMVRYIKNIGSSTSIFCMWTGDNYNVDIKFSNGKEYMGETLVPTKVAKVKFYANLGSKDSKATVNLYLASRVLKYN